MRSDDEVEHYSDLWFEVVVLDSLVEHIDASDIDESFSWREFSARAAAMLPPSDAPPAAMLPPSDAPPTEAELFARLDLTLADVRRAKSEGKKTFRWRELRRLTAFLRRRSFLHRSFVSARQFSPQGLEPWSTG